MSFFQGQPGEFAKAHLQKISQTKYIVIKSVTLYVPHNGRRIPFEIPQGFVTDGCSSRICPDNLGSDAWVMAWLLHDYVYALNRRHGGGNYFVHNFDGGRIRIDKAIADKALFNHSRLGWYAWLLFMWSGGDDDAWHGQ
jgi:hypothetical protein